MPIAKTETREPRFCRVCGKKLVSWYYYAGYCATCFSYGDTQLVEDAKKAKEYGISYGKYMALKKEGLLRPPYVEK